MATAEKEPGSISKTTIRLQLILMESIPSIISKNKDGSIRMLPEQLGKGDEQEILKLALDVGNALKKAHEKKILHRDIKLENVFYSEKKKQYKLGDFGSAKKTDDGFASTIAFTRGYAAPEVRISKEKYDNTADIYSFGMMLYVLANGLKFPASATYAVNSAAQYTPGFVLPYPENNISGYFYYILLKACNYDADQRYQSIDEMLHDIEKLVYSSSFSYKRIHKNEYLLVSSITLFFGIIAWKLTLAPNFVINFSLLEYIFLALGLGKSILILGAKKTKPVSMAMLGIGIYLLYTTGFSWTKLIFLLWMIYLSDLVSGYVSAAVLFVNFISLIQQINGSNLTPYTESSWVAVWIFSITLILLLQYSMLSEENSFSSQRRYEKSHFWLLVSLIYTICIVYENLINRFFIKICEDFLRPSGGDFTFAINGRMVGIYGLGFVLLWLIRERLLIQRQKKQVQKINAEYSRQKLNPMLFN